MNNFDKTFNKIIAECNDGKSVAFSDSMVRANRLENYKSHAVVLEKQCLAAARRQIIDESIFQNVDPLIDDIMSRIENEEYEFAYSKEDLLKFMAGFRHREKFEKEVPSRFKLSVICTTGDEFYRRFDIKLTPGAVAEEVLDPDDEWHEMIVIVSGEGRRRYSTIREYLKEELRHVWTYVFGMVDDSFYIGRTSFKAEDQLDYRKFNSYQRQVLKDMYFGDLDALQKDYDYIFKIQEGNAENWELSVHVDAIIDMLIDYYDGSISTEKYLKEVLDDVKHNRVSPSNKMLQDFYKNDDPVFKPMKDNIRRLFLLYAFGSEEHLGYFEEECRKEF